MRCSCKNIQEEKATYIHSTATITHLTVCCASNKVKISQKIRLLPTVNCIWNLRSKPVLIADVTLTAWHLDRSRISQRVNMYKSSSTRTGLVQQLGATPAPPPGAVPHGMDLSGQAARFALLSPQLHSITDPDTAKPTCGCAQQLSPASRFIVVLTWCN